MGQAGYMRRRIEQANQYILLVYWKSVAAHEEGFHQSPVYQKWKVLLHHFYDSFPTVQRYASL